MCRKVGEGDRLKMFPLWSIILSVVVFVGWQYFMNHNAMQPHHHPTELQQYAGSPALTSAHDPNPGATSFAVTVQLSALWI
jgi:predicted negative regulator of RcsB-dependent stress response